MSQSSSRLALAFSCVGHAYVHLFTAFYFVVVLALETEWRLPYHQLIELWTAGALLVGLGALPAGWIADRWRPGGMMVVFFIGMGGASIACGFARGPTGMLVGLAAIGLFASIYHPVGVAWLVRNSDANRGKLLGVNGIFGSIGIAAAGLVAGALIDGSGWRAAFIVPGAVCVATGLALLLCLRLHLIDDGGTARRSSGAGESRGDMMRTFAVLLLTMFVGAIVFHSTQAALPKLFAERLASLVDGRALGVGTLVAVVYGVSGFVQIVGGHFADRRPLKQVYVGFILAQVPLLLAAAALSGLPLVGAALLMVPAAAAALPAENMLLARYTPEQHHSLAYGAKFVLYFGAGPLALLLVSTVREATGGFYWLFAILAAAAALATVAALMLPGGRVRTPVAAPAE